jgi:5'-methylthioadenosine phosphorylase
MNGIKIGLIGGTGLGQALGTQVGTTRHEIDTPFGRPSDGIIQTVWSGVPVFALSRHGPGHYLPPAAVPYRANIYALKQLGVTHIIAGGAVGSLREEYRPRDLVIADQIIDKTHQRAGTFYEQAAVHVEFAEPFCPILRQILIEAGQRAAADGAGTAEQPGAAAPAGAPFTVHDRGCYVCMEGPAFSTRAESLIGMTGMPEAKLAREAEISYALVALVTDYDCWRHKPVPPGAVDATDKAELIKEILGHLQAATTNAMSLIRHAVALLAERGDALGESPAHKALELAIWSDKSRISREEVQRLAPLWIKYFGQEHQAGAS